MELLIKETALDLLAGLKLDEATVRVTRTESPAHKEEEYYRVDINCTEAPRLIGRHGDTLLSFQHILQLIAAKRADEKEGRHVVVTVDVDGYRARQAEEAVELAVRLAKQVQESGKAVRLPPMSGFLRRMVHLHFTGEEWADITTESAGMGPTRAIVLKPVVAAEAVAA